MSSPSQKLFKGAVLAFAGSAALAAGSARAAITPPACAPANLGSLAPVCSFNNWLVTITKQEVTNSGLFAVSFSDLDINFDNKLGNLNIGISSSSNGSTPPRVGTLEYTLSFLNPAFLTSAELSSTRNPLAAGAYGTLVSAGLGVNFSDDGGPQDFGTTYPVTGSFTSTVTGNGSAQNIFTSDVPVPLPVVGAGLAFGFTRKLRNRAKSLA